MIDGQASCGKDGVRRLAGSVVGRSELSVGPWPSLYLHGMLYQTPWGTSTSVVWRRELSLRSMARRRAYPGPIEKGRNAGTSASTWPETFLLYHLSRHCSPTTLGAVPVSWVASGAERKGRQASRPGGVVHPDEDFGRQSGPCRRV